MVIVLIELEQNVLNLYLSQLFCYVEFDWSSWHTQKDSPSLKRRHAKKSLKHDLLTIPYNKKRHTVREND